MIKLRPAAKETTEEEEEMMKEMEIPVKKKTIV